MLEWMLKVKLRVVVFFGKMCIFFLGVQINIFLLKRLLDLKFFKNLMVLVCGFFRIFCMLFSQCLQRLGFFDIFLYFQCVVNLCLVILFMCIEWICIFMKCFCGLMMVVCRDLYLFDLGVVIQFLSCFGIGVCIFVMML